MKRGPTGLQAKSVDRGVASVPGGCNVFHFVSLKMGRKRKYASGRDRVRAYRARRKAESLHRLDAPAAPVVALVDHVDPVGALAEWSRGTLVVPPGHPRSGEPLELMPFAVDWLRETWARMRRR